MDMNPLNLNAISTTSLTNPARIERTAPENQADPREQDIQDSVSVHDEQTRRKSESRGPVETPVMESPVEELPAEPEKQPEAAEAPRTSGTASSRNTTTITILSTNDLHGYYKGMANLAGLVHELKHEHPDALMVDVGDVCYNPPYSDANHYEPMVDIMNSIGYNVVTLGNHEFQWGATRMHDEYVSKIEADVVSANIKDLKTNDYLPDVKPYVIKDVNGVKVGIMGTVVPDMATSANPHVGKDVKRLDIEDTVRALIPKMKEEGAEVIVLLSHHGVHKGADVDLAKNVEGIDVIFTGHDHQLTEEPIVVSKFPSKTYIFQSMSHAKYVGETTIEVDAKTHDIISINMKAIPTKSYTSKPDPVVEDILKNYQGKDGGRVEQHREQHHYPRPGKKHKR